MTTAAEAWTVRRLLEATAGYFTKKDVDQPRLSTELLLAHVLGVPRIRLYTDYERVVDDERIAQFRELVRRAGEQEPIAYLTGVSHFFGLELIVTRDTLIPRPDTETVVEAVLQSARFDALPPTPRVLDLCTGSGCIALAVATRMAAADVTAADVSDAALEVATRNAEKLGLRDRLTFARGDLFDALRDVPDPSPFDLITANPPYIRSDLLPKLDRSVRDYEPSIALDGGGDGLEPLRRILSQLADHLNPGGSGFFEIAYDQGEAALAAAARAPGLREPRLLRDAAGHNRVLCVKRA
jgi:release factor glutamine methyltransferase